MRKRNVSNQVPAHSPEPQDPAAVSLADAPAKLREVREHIGGLHRFMPDEWLDKPSLKADMDTLDALASSLEQTQGPASPGLRDVERVALEWAINTASPGVAKVLGHLLDRNQQSTNIRSNEDTVTITLSREELDMVGLEVERATTNAEGSVTVPGDFDLPPGIYIDTSDSPQAKKWDAISKRLKAAKSALQPPTPERRE